MTLVEVWERVKSLGTFEPPQRAPTNWILLERGHDSRPTYLTFRTEGGREAVPPGSRAQSEIFRLKILSRGWIVCLV